MWEKRVCYKDWTDIRLGGIRMTELKKCPFCGSKARLNVCNEKYFVECSHENWCETLPKTWLYNTKEEAIEAWNRRAE